MRKVLILALLSAGRLVPQTLEVRSEFLRVGPQGDVLPVDATPNPREILSPAIVRNGFASFHVVVRSSRVMNYFLYAVTNPPDVLRTTLYKEAFVNHNGEWIPDLLKPPPIANFGAIPDGEAGIPEQTACVYLLDVWAPPNAVPSTVRLELQLKVGRWIIYPMEVRILPAQAPAMGLSSRALPSIEQRSDEAVTEPFLRFVSGRDSVSPRRKAASQRAPQTVREVIRRNVEQDIGLARLADPKVVIPALKQKLAVSDGGSEWYLKIRDMIYRLSSSQK